MSNTLVLQSHCKPLPAEWMQECLNSVQNWSELNTFDYKFIGDELFEYVPDSILEKTKVQRVIATDLARLKAIKSYLVDGYETVVWCDADFLIFSPEKFLLPKDKYAVGREVWVQAVEEKSKKLSAHVKVHNAFMMYRTGNTFLEFYIDTAERLLINNIGRMSPQFIGPKLLTAIHNVAQCPVLETAGMLSPLVIQDVAKGGGAALELFLKKSSETIYAANLCNSLFERKEYSANVIEKCVTTLISGKGISV
jgi:hypothetical protein